MKDHLITETRTGGWMQTASGLMFFHQDPRPEDICIEDIAAALSKICRYAGHCKQFYSVAQHSVLVSHFVEPEHALWGLLHDAAEAYVVDVPTPLKRLLPDYEKMEDNVLEVICRKFGLQPGMPAEVKRVDNAILADEQKHLMSKPPAAWHLPELPLGLPTIPLWEPELAERNFLTRFNQLTQ